MDTLEGSGPVPVLTAYRRNNAFFRIGFEMKKARGGGSWLSGAIKNGVEMLM